MQQFVRKICSTEDLGELKTRSGESKWYPGELLKCFRDERFSACGEKRMKDPRGFTLYIDTCQHACSRLLGHKARIPSYGARSDSWGFLRAA